MNQGKYPVGLLIVGWITNVLFRFVWLFIPAAILLVVGIFFRPCLYIGLILLSLDLLVSFLTQWNLRRAFLRESDDPDFKAFQASVSKEGSWHRNVMDFVERKMEEQADDGNRKDPS